MALFYAPKWHTNINGEGLAENEWLVYLVSASDGSDYHWYRQNPDGSWSHKPGNTPVTNREFLGVAYYSDGKEELLYGDVIYDPTTISRVAYEYTYDENGTLIGAQETMDYDNVVGAFVVGY